jgi:SAM-dependent methyltransferase
MAFTNCYEDVTRAEAYAQLEFANTYYLAYRDLPVIIREHVTGTRAIDFGCGTGRSTRFVRRLGLDATGVDIAPEMIAKARELDPAGDYRLVKDDDLSSFQDGTYDLVLSVFTFDNIPGFDTKVRLFRDLGELLKASGKIVNVVSSPEIYVHEWASFSTKDYPENRFARSGDTVRIITTDFADRRPAQDILWTDESYRDVYARAGLTVVATYKPLARGDEPYKWVNETSIAPWVIYVLMRQAAGSSSSSLLRHNH